MERRRVKSVIFNGQLEVIVDDEHLLVDHEEDIITQADKVRW